MTDFSTNRGSRRGFFQQVAAHLLHPLTELIEPSLNKPCPVTFLRPPGAQAESALIATCRRCGACVEACPADAIFSLADSFDDAAGTPAIDADRAACVVCDGLQCTQVCPSGALQLLTSPEQIRMGTASVYASLCVRSRGESCTLCIEACPMGEAALYLGDDDLPVVEPRGCVGCGVCQLHCPTSPKAIVVRPASEQV